jgi:hypothetical protein
LFSYIDGIFIRIHPRSYQLVQALMPPVSEVLMC